jgi:hypothetical protein
MMKIFWVVTYLGLNDVMGQARFDDEDSAREYWYKAEAPLFLDQVHRYESNI